MGTSGRPDCTMAFYVLPDSPYVHITARRDGIGRRDIGRARPHSQSRAKTPGDVIHEWASRKLMQIVRDFARKHS